MKRLCDSLSCLLVIYILLTPELNLLHLKFNTTTLKIVLPQLPYMCDASSDIVSEAIYLNMKHHLKGFFCSIVKKDMGVEKE